VRKFFAGTILLMLSAFTGAIALAASERGSFDPDTCWQDSGRKIIVRLTSGKAFAFEPLLLSVRVGKDAVVGPDLPPEGCPGNPLVFGGISFFSKSYMEEALGGLDFTAPERLEIFGHAGPVGSQRVSLKLFDYFIKLYGVEHCSVLPGNLEVCRACTHAEGTADQCSTGASENSSRPKVVGYERVAARYRALPGMYFEYDGLPFAGECTWPVWKDRPRKCKFHYQLEDGLSVAYTINDFDVPETEFISYDRHIRNLILSTRAPQYDLSPKEMERFQ